MHTKFLPEQLKWRCHSIPKYKGEDNIKIDLKEIGCEGVDMVERAQNWAQ